LDWEDVRQHLHVEWLSASSLFNSYVLANDKGSILVSLARWAGDYCQKETEQRDSTRKDQFYYSREQLKALLPYVDTPEHWTSLAAPSVDEGGGRSKSDPAVGGTLMAVYADLRRAWEQLEMVERILLRNRFPQGTPTAYKLLASSLKAQGVTDEADARKRVERALSKMCRTMGGIRRQRGESAGGRRAVSNATAAAVLSNQYNGG
jgi:hypothetical protein